MKERKVKYILILAFLFSCNNAEERTTIDISPYPSVTTGNDTGNIKVDSFIRAKIDSVTINKTDTGKKIIRLFNHKINTNKKSAVLGYSYFTHMRQNETRSIYAQVKAINITDAINKIAEDVMMDLKDVNNQIKPTRKSDTASYFTDKNIYYYKYLTITLNDPDGNFKIDSSENNQRQEIDIANDEKNVWHWAVTPKTSVSNARLFIRVIAEKEDGVKKTIDTREIAINIQLETNFWRTLIDWLVKNPEKLLVLILIPLVAYFGKKIFDRNKASKESTQN
jgi:hypothetical protein